MATSAIPSPNASVSVPANNQQCLNDSIIDTERSRGEVTGHSPLGFPYHCLGKVSSISQPRMLRGASLSHLGRRLEVLKVRDRLGGRREGERRAPRGEADRGSSGGKKGEGHTSAPTYVSAEDWPRKCDSQPPVSRKLIQNVSRVVPDNLGILILPLLLTVLRSKVTGSISFSFSSIFTIDQVWNFACTRRQIPSRLLTFACFPKKFDSP